MASLVLSAGMSAVGGAIGGNFGAQVGWLLGQSLFGQKPPTQYGPRLGDTRVQVSTYGKAVPQIFGTARVAGNLIWSTRLIETAHTSSTGGGKGGGGGGATQVTYTYSASFAISLCQTTTADGTNHPITGIGKIWADGMLIANFGSLDPGTVMASYANGGGKNGQGVGYIASGSSQLYTGTETQNPDPTMQAYLGAANTPAFRGMAYIVFNNFQLQKFGNRIPNIEVEVIGAGSFASQLTLQNTQNNLVAYPVQCSRLTANASVFAISGQLANTSIYSINSPGVPKLIATVTSGANAQSACYGSLVAVTGSNTVIYDGTNGNAIRTIALYSTSIAMDANYVYTVSNDSIGMLTITGVNGNYVSQLAIGANPVSIIVQGSYLYIACQGANYLAAVNVSNPAAPYIAWTLAGFGSVHSEVFGSYLLMVGSNLDIYTLNGDVVPVHVSTTASVASGLASCIAATGNYLIVEKNGTGIQAFDVSNPSAPVQACVLAGYFPYALCAYNGYVYFGGYAGGVAPLYTAFLAPNVISSGGTTVAAIIGQVAAQVGATALDVSQVTDAVDGYVIGTQMTARAAIEPLQKAFYFDAVESDNVIRFAKRGIQPITIIPEDDLAAHSPQTKQVPASVEVTRIQDLDLPRICNVAYYNKGNAYLQGAQHSTRQTVQSKQTIDLQIPICLTDAHAKQMADVNLYVAWTERNTVRFSTTRKYLYLDPSDVVQITKASGVTYTLLITKKTEKAGGIIDWEAVADDASVYTQQSAASTPSVTVVDTIAPIQNTRLEFLDLPIMRDTDDATATGFYTAANGYASGWPGGQLSKSSDGGTTYAIVETLPLPGAVMGTAMGVLGTFSGGNTVDEKNQLSVMLDTGTLAGITLLQLLNGSNYAVVGNEIIQFRDATLTALNTYTIGGLLRGRFGTEQYIGTHGNNERFVLLDPATMGRVPASINEIGLARQFKPVTLYQQYSAVTPINFTDTGAGAKPLSPVLIGGGRDASGNLTINWTRRSRIGAGWNNFADVPLGEASESYSIDIMSGTTVKRTLTSTTPTVQYTSAQQVADFGSNQSAVLVNVYQISATIGRGYPGTATV